VRFFPLLLPILALVTLAGCESPAIVTHSTHHKTYRHVTVTNPRGEFVAEWTAVGSVTRTNSNAYRFRAVQRISAPPYSEEIHYPEGRLVEITGPAIIVARCGKPLWLYEYEGY
jgi:hypothetical protein